MTKMTEAELMQLLAAITPPDEAARAAAHAHWASLAKPLGGLGALETMLEDAAALTGTAQFDFSRRAVVVLCADNGVVAQGISQTDQSVTRAVAENLAARRTSVCRMAQAAHCDVLPVDLGIVGAPVPGVRDCRIAAGTADFTKGPAMTRAEAVEAIGRGIALTRQLAAEGYGLVATGEMGIGNTTTSSAVAAVLLAQPVQTMTGRGAGLSDAGLARKVEAIRRGIACCARADGWLHQRGGSAVRRAAVPGSGQGRVCQPLLHRACRPAGAGRAGQNAPAYRRAASGRGYRRSGQYPTVGHGAGGVRGVLFLCGGRHCAVYAPMLTLVLGGAASGKSEYAEALVLRSALPRYYLATMQVWDAECAARVEKHRKMRAAKQFETLECPLHLETVHLPRRGTALLEDLGNLTANELYDPAGAGDAAAEHILQGLESLAAQCENLIVVSNEVFSGGADYAGDTDRYLLALARVNNALAARADAVVRVVCGIPVYYKGVEK